MPGMIIRGWRSRYVCTFYRYISFFKYNKCSRKICRKFPDFAMKEEGFGDLSIIRAYEKYKDETPAIHKIRIWSVDSHLKGIYEETIEPINLRNK